MRYKAANREKIRAKGKAYYSDPANREKHLARNRAYYSDPANREKRRAYHAANRERVSAWRAAYFADKPAKKMFIDAKCRAAKRGVPFAIEESDIVIPERCPVLGIVLKHGRGKGKPTSASPSLDRIVPSLGYVRGNIEVISHRANLLKNDATPAELAAVALYYLEKLNGPKGQRPVEADSERAGRGDHGVPPDGRSG